VLLGRAIVRGQEPVILLGHSEPQPDVAIVRHQTDRFMLKLVFLIIGYLI